MNALNKQKLKHHLLLNEFLSAEHELSDLRQILHSAPEAILITNSAVEIIYVNPAWEQLTGYSFAEVQKKSPKFLQCGKTTSEVYKQMWKRLKNNLPFTHDDFIDKKKDGTEFYAHSTFFPVLRFGVPIFYVQFLYDITEKKNEEHQRRELLSFVSHELKTPISVLKLLLSSRMKRNKPFIKKDLVLMSSELDRLTELINESLDISRIDSDRLYLNPRHFDINELIEDVFIHLSSIIDGHQLKIESVPNLYVIADYNRIKQVLINFITNAVKYSKIGTPIELLAIKKGKKVIVSVKDVGMGIPTDRLPFVFDKFFQVKKKSTEGLGLGLYISSEIMKKHHGKIGVSSKPGEGSTFYFSLPLKV